MEPQKTPNSQAILRERKEFQTILQSYSNQNIMMRKQTHRSMERNRNPEINPCFHGDKGGETIQWGKDRPFNK